MLNTIQLIGRLTKEPDLRYTQSGKAVALATLAVQRSFKNQNGEYEADFIRLKIFDKRGEMFANYVQKGHIVGVSGSLRTGSYQDDQGNTVYTSDVVVDEITLLPNNKVDNTQNHAETFDISDDDLPF